MSNEDLKQELESLRNEVEELRKYKNAWEKTYPGITVESVMNLEQQLYELYRQFDENDGDESLVTDYETQLQNRSNQ